MNLPFSHPKPNPTPTIPALVKQEVKIEAEETIPSQLPSSTSLLNLKAPQTKSTFNMSLFDQPALPFLFDKTTEPKLTHFPLIIHDPFTIKAFAHFQAAFNDFLKGSMPSIPTILNLQTIPPPTRKAPKKAVTPSTVASETCVVKKEEGTEENPVKLPETQEPPKKTPKKKAQNRIKNIPGLIMQRVRSSIKAYFARSPKYLVKDCRLAYVEKVLDPLPMTEKERLVTFLEQYQKNWKTWHTIQMYLMSNERSGEILLDCVLEFFKEDGDKDFDDWMNGGKMSEKSKAAVNELKVRIGQKFSKLLSKTDLGEDEELLKSTEKLVKKEENLGNYSKFEEKRE